MRVTSEMMSTNALRRLSTRLSSYERVQTRLATGKQFQVASENIGGSVRAQTLRSSMRAREQEQRNADDARSWLDITDSQLQSAVDRLARARDLAVRGANTMGEDERTALAKEVEAVQADLVSIANAQHRGRPIFAGFSDQKPVTGAPGGPWGYTGDMGTVTRRVGEHDVVPINVTAYDAFGFGTPGGDIFSTLDRLVTSLKAGDIAGVGTAIAGIDAGRASLTESLATVGSRTNWVESARHRSQDTLHALRTELAEVEDVDIAEAIMNLQVEEIAYEATLQAVARALPPSLASFLR